MSYLVWHCRRVSARLCEHLHSRDTFASVIIRPRCDAAPLLVIGRLTLNPHYTQNRLRSGVTTWEGRSALTQGRIYGVFQDKQGEFERCYDRIIRYIRRHWRKNPVPWMGGYVGPAASDWFDGGGLLLPNYIPPVRSDWIQRLGDQHPHRLA